MGRALLLSQQASSTRGVGQPAPLFAFSAQVQSLASTGNKAQRTHRLFSHHYPLERSQTASNPPHRTINPTHPRQQGEYHHCHSKSPHADYPQTYPQKPTHSKLSTACGQTYPQTPYPHPVDKLIHSLIHKVIHTPIKLYPQPVDKVFGAAPPEK